MGEGMYTIETSQLLILTAITNKTDYENGSP